jgi:hydroxyacid-oxoacid transhydrogenase
MDTAKAANLFVNYPDADMFDFINAPIGKGKPIDRKLSPLICSTSSPCSATTTDTQFLLLPYVCRVGLTDV